MNASTEISSDWLSFLTTSAAALLYASSKSKEVKASFDSRLNKKSNQLLSNYREVFIASEKEVNLDTNIVEENTDTPQWNHYIEETHLIKYSSQFLNVFFTISNIFK